MTIFVSVRRFTQKIVRSVFSLFARKPVEPGRFLLYAMMAIIGLCIATGVWFLAESAWEFIQVDRCLDMGGVWDRDENICTY